METPIIIGQACAYCLEPFERYMVPVHFHSRSSGNSQIWLHVRCAETAFRGACVPFDVADATVELRSRPSGGVAEYPGDPDRTS